MVGDLESILWDCNGLGAVVEVDRMHPMCAGIRAQALSVSSTDSRAELISRAKEAMDRRLAEEARICTMLEF